MRDGLRILGTIGRLVQRERPLPFYGWLGASLAAFSVGLASYRFREVALARPRFGPQLNWDPS